MNIIWTIVYCTYIRVPLCLVYSGVLYMSAILCTVYAFTCVSRQLRFGLALVEQFPEILVQPLLGLQAFLQFTLL